MKSLTALLVLGLAVSGCSSSGSDTPQLGAESTTSTATATSTTRPSTTTSLPSSTSTTSTTRPPAVQPSTSSSSPPTAQTVELLLAGRVRAFFDTREAANAAPAPNPDFPQLPDVATGEALQSVRDETTRRRDQGQAIRDGAQNLAAIRVGFVTVTGTTATVAACSIDDGVIFDVASGRIVNDAVYTHNYRIDLEQSGDIWRVSRIVRIQQWDGRAGCANSPGDFPY